MVLPSANNFAMKGKRKTLNAGDVLSAMEEMEFQRFVAPLKESLEGTVLRGCPGTLSSTESCSPRTLDKQHLLPVLFLFSLPSILHCSLPGE